MNTDRFRFRVWDNANKRYVDTFSDPYNRIWRWYIDIDGNLIGVDEDNVDRVQDKENFIIEQCTGLKDKNGELIYEGDMVKCDLDNQRKNMINQVVWWKGCFCMMRYTIVQEYVYEYYNIEIIGNIHEYERKNNA